MLKKLRELLPDFEITKDGILYDFKRTSPKGNIIHIPAILTKATTPEQAAKMVMEGWEDNYA